MCARQDVDPIEDKNIKEARIVPLIRHVHINEYFADAREYSGPYTGRRKINQQMSTGRMEKCGDRRDTKNLILEPQSENNRSGKHNRKRRESQKGIDRCFF